jgi:hypothetical protein
MSARGRAEGQHPLVPGIWLPRYLLALPKKIATTTPAVANPGAWFALTDTHLCDDSVRACFRDDHLGSQSVFSTYRRGTTSRGGAC